MHKGIPEPLRALAWRVLSGCRAAERAGRGAAHAVGGYGALRQRALTSPAAAGEELYSCATDSIELDLRRTFPSHVMWRSTDADGSSDGSSRRSAADNEEGAPASVAATAASPSRSSPAGVERLRLLLRMYALLDSDVRYCQSMNFVGGALLMYMPDEPAFSLFAHLLSASGLNLRRLYLPGLPLLRECLDELRELLWRHLPLLARRLEQEGVELSLFATQWFMTLGLDHFEFDFALRLIDLVTLEQGLAPVFRMAIALLLRQQKALLATKDSTQLMLALRNLPATIDDAGNFFARDVQSIRVVISRSFE